MSFGLVTCLNVEDVPKMLLNAARNYRGNSTRLEYDGVVWKMIADRVDDFAHLLQAEIAAEVAAEKLRKPRRQRERLR